MSNSNQVQTTHTPPLKKVADVDLWERHTGEVPAYRYAEFWYEIEPDVIYLPFRDCGNDARFARIFQQVWGSLDPGVRSSIITQWDTHFIGGCPCGPRILFSDQWDDHVPFQHELARAANFGATLMFNPRLIDAMPVSCVATTIAHELGHVLQWSQDRMTTPEDNDRVEAENRAMMLEWGFDEYELDDWLEGNTEEPDPESQREVTFEEMFQRIEEKKLALEQCERVPQLERRPGTYAVGFYCETISNLAIGELGSLSTRCGYYVYVGSAFGPGGIGARILRHFHADQERRRWHIDYMRPALKFHEVWYTFDPESRECAWSDVLASMTGALVPMPGFGVTDCTAGCESHLYFFPSCPSVATFRRRVKTLCPQQGVIHRKQL